MIEIKKSLFKTSILVSEDFRALVMVRGKYQDILKPGHYSYLSMGKNSYLSLANIDPFNIIKSPELDSNFAASLTRARPDLVAEHFTTIQTTADQVAIVRNNGQLRSVIKPQRQVLMWKEAGPWEVELITVPEDAAIPAALATELTRLVVMDLIKRFNVELGQVGLLFIDNVLTRQLPPGAYAFWSIGKSVAMKIVDTRLNAIDVAGQEILTRDKVAIRVNLASAYRVVDPMLAVTTVKDYVDALYRALQHAFRQLLATRSLDDILSRKGEVDGEAAEAVRREMSLIGLEVADIAIKDVILPGDMRSILNGVVSAEKEAEAQVIRRREETNATRSLLNTARVMAENPVMLRLKELEALEKIADKVQNLVVHNGTQGLLDMVSLQSAPAPQAKRVGK